MSIPGKDMCLGFTCRECRFFNFVEVDAISYEPSWFYGAEMKSISKKELELEEKMRRAAILKKACDEDECSLCHTYNSLFVSDNWIGYDCEVCGGKVTLWEE